MITYIDTSVLVKLLVAEQGSETAQEIWQAADRLVAVTLVEVEARAALAAASRAGRLTPVHHRRAKSSLRLLLDMMDVIDVSEELVTSAGDLAEIEALRGYDAIHLAGALQTADVLATADLALGDAGERQGLPVANPIDRPGRPGA